MSLIHVNWKPDPRQLRGFGLLCLIAFSAIGVWLYWKSSLFGIDFRPEGSRIVGFVLWGVAGLCGVLALTAPVVLRPLYVVLTAVSLPVGFVLSHVLMALMFYGVLTPVAVVFRLMGRDPLDRVFDRDRSSYWVRRRPVRDVKRYFRQY